MMRDKGTYKINIEVQIKSALSLSVKLPEPIDEGRKFHVTSSNQTIDVEGYSLDAGESLTFVPTKSGWKLEQ